MSECVVVDRELLLERVTKLRHLVREHIGPQALAMRPTKRCDRTIRDLLDSLNSLEMLLEAQP